MPMNTIPKVRNADGSLKIHKLVGFNAFDMVGRERDDLICIALMYAETEEDFQKQNFTVKQFAFPRRNAHLLAKAIMNIAELSEKEGPWPIDPMKKH